MKAITVCLTVVILALLLVGLISATVVRHLVQISVAAVVLAAVRGGRAWAVYAALPVFLIWLFLMLLIWMYLLGLSTIAAGRFTPAEVALTVVIGISSVWGVAAALRASRGPWTRLAAAAASAAVLQIAVLWLSFRLG